MSELIGFDDAITGNSPFTDFAAPTLQMATMDEKEAQKFEDEDNIDASDIFDSYYADTELYFDDVVAYDDDTVDFEY